MRWPRIEEIYGSTLRQSSVFKRGDAEADARWQELHQRVIEHVSPSILLGCGFLYCRIFELLRSTI